MKELPFQKYINKSNEKIISFNVYPKAHCTWEKSAKCENL